MPNKNLGPRILELRAQGKSYNQISEELNCSKGTVSFHLGEGQKGKQKKRNQVRLSQGLPSVEKKVSQFKSPGRRLSDKVGNFCRVEGEREHSDFSVKDLLDKYGESTECYLTGDSVNMLDPSTYELDHVVSRHRGGSNNLSNLGIATKEANRAKGTMSVDEFVALCRKVVSKFDGYEEDG